jgi:hypothetical protein
MQKIEVMVSWSGDNYCAGSGNIGGVVLVTHKTFEGLKKEFAETFKFHIEGCIADGDVIPEFIKKGEYEIDFKLHTSALLHRIDGIITRAAISRLTGINEKQLGHYLTGYRNPRPAQREKIINGLHKIGQEFITVV